MAVEVKKLILYEHKDSTQDKTSPFYKRPSIILETRQKNTSSDVQGYVFGVFKKIFKDKADLYGECSESYRLVCNQTKDGANPSSCFVLDQSPEGYLELRSDSPNKTLSKERLAKMVRQILEDNPNAEVEDKEGYLKD
jgi:hypothetical protein